MTAILMFKFYQMFSNRLDVVSSLSLARQHHDASDVYEQHAFNCAFISSFLVLLVVIL